VVAHARALVKLPATIPFAAASTLMCTAGVALHALRDRAKLVLGETVLITGASGGVGSAAIQVARRMGARVIAATTSLSKVAALTDLGAHEVVAVSEEDFHDEVIARTGGGVDACLELTGSATFRSGLKSLRRGGRMVVVGNIEATKVEVNPGALIVNGHSIIGSASCTRQDMTDVFTLVEGGDLWPRIDRTLPLEQASYAHQLLADRAVVGRIVLVP
jgi:acryloyl-coenzyme A reductase